MIAFYESLWLQPGICGVPTLLWLAWLLASRSARKQPLWLYSVVFAVESALDAWLTAGTVVGVGKLPGVAASALPFLFVVLGDLRVYWLLAPKRWMAVGLALGPTLASAVVLRVLQSDQARVTYLVYEIAFFALGAVTYALWLRPQAARRSAADRKIWWMGYALTYYALWITADVWLLSAGPEADAAWVVRVAANVMYYVGWGPWAYFASRGEERAQA